MVYTPISSIRESLLTLESVPLDAPLAPAQRDSIRFMQELAAAELDSVRDRIESRSLRFLSTDLDLLKRELLRMAARGMERESLDLFATIVHASEIKVFCEVARIDALAENRLPDRSYRFPLPAYFSAGQLGLMPPPQAVRALLGDLRRALSHDDSTVSRHAFDKLVTQRLIAIEFAAWVATPEPKPVPSSHPWTPSAPEMDPEEQRIQGWRRSAGDP